MWGFMVSAVPIVIDAAFADCFAAFADSLTAFFDAVGACTGVDEEVPMEFEMPN